MASSLSSFQPAASPLSYAASRSAAPTRLRSPSTPARRAGVASRDHTALGVLAILASTASFPLSDLASQSLIPGLGPIEVVWLRYMVFFMVALPVLVRGGGVLRTSRPWLQLLRGAASAMATLAAIVAFKFLAVPEATAIGFVAPMIVTLLAVLVLREKVGMRRWGAGLLALVGVLVIVRPGNASFCAAAFIPLVGAVASAVAVICTRVNKADGPGTTMLYSAAIGLVILSCVVPFHWHALNLAQLRMALVVGIFGTLGTLLQVVAYRLAPASLLSPFTSMQLVWAGGFSFLFLGTMPGSASLIGGSIIAASAIYTGWRERQRSGTDASSLLLTGPIAYSAASSALARANGS